VNWCGCSGARARNCEVPESGVVRARMRHVTCETLLFLVWTCSAASSLCSRVAVALRSPYPFSRFRSRDTHISPPVFQWSRRFDEAIVLGPSEDDRTQRVQR
jgi:hypothetical protein